jgi:XRE family transcriptional regulator, regulator of sulfur utilization
MQLTPRQIGMKLKRFRRAKKLSKYALAEQAGISAAYVAKVEAGRSDPTVGMLQRLAKNLACPLTIEAHI